VFGGFECERPRIARRESAAPRSRHPTRRRVPHRASLPTAPSAPTSPSMRHRKLELAWSVSRAKDSSKQVQLVDVGVELPGFESPSACEGCGSVLSSRDLRNAPLTPTAGSRRRRGALFRPDDGAKITSTKKSTGGTKTRRRRNKSVNGEKVFTREMRFVVLADTQSAEGPAITIQRLFLGRSLRCRGQCPMPGRRCYATDEKRRA